MKKLTEEEKTFLSYCMNSRINDLKLRAKHYPDGGFSNEAVESAESLMFSIQEKL